MIPNTCDVASIPQTYKRLHEEGYQVSMCTLRRWVRQGILRAAYAGQKALIYYPNVLQVLREGTEPPVEVQQQLFRLMQQ